MTNQKLKCTSNTYNFTGIVEKRNYKDVYRFGYVRILLREVRFGKLLFRDHLWVREDKHSKKLESLNLIKFTAKIKEYVDADNLNSFKLGLVKVRNIKKIKTLKKIEMCNDHYRESL